MTAPTYLRPEPEWGSEVVRRDHGTPFLVYRPRPRSALDLLAATTRWGDRTALVHDGERLTYAGLSSRTEQGAARLRAFGVGPGDRVLLLGANSTPWVVAFWAILRAGAVVVLGNGWWSADEVAHAVGQTTPRLVLADRRCRPTVGAGVVVDELEDIGAGGPGAPPPWPDEDEDAPAVIQFTSGSTGAPKGAVLSHRALIANQHMLLAVSRHLPHQLDPATPGEVSLQTGPLFHVGGIQALLRSLVTGGTVVFLRRRFDPAEVLALIESERISRWGGAPTMVSRVLAHADMATRDLSSLTHITLGGAPVSVELVAEIQARFPAASRGLSQVYGMSEAGGTLCAASGRASAERPGVTGRPLPLVELRIDAAGPDGVGEIVARTPTGMDGYWGATGPDPIFAGDGWLRTGDLGRLDAEGWLYVTGRSKDVIIRGGENIAAVHVEDALLRHPDLIEAAVVARPDPDLGEIVGAAVVRRPGATVGAAELREFAARSLAHFEVPERWWITDDPLPVNATGKIDKPAVRRAWPAGHPVPALVGPAGGVSPGRTAAAGGDGTVGLDPVAVALGAADATPGELRPAFALWLADHAAALEEFKVVPEELGAQMTALRSFQRLLFDSGWLRLGWPAPVGGLGGSALLRSALSEEMARSAYPPPFSFGVIEILAPAVVRFGRPELAAEMVPKLLRGDEAWCQGFSEPGAGSDLGSLRTRAVAVDDGFVVNGQKVWTSWGHYADRCILLARTGTTEEGHRGITAFFLDMDQRGVTVRELRAMNGAGEFSELFLDDVHVPADRVLGTVGGGWAVTMGILASERGAVAWQRVTWMLRRLEDLVAQVGDRPDTHARIGQLHAQLYALRLMSRRTLLRLDAGGEVGPASSIDKILMATAEQGLFDAALDLLPGAVLVDDGPGARAWRNDYLYSRAASIYGGTSEIQHSIVAERLLGLPRSG